MAGDVVPAAPATSPEPAAVILPDEPPVADNLPMKPRMATLATEADYSRAATDEKSTPPPRMLPAADRARIACSLLSSFDFAGKGSVSHDDWLRGISLIALWDGDSAVWQRLSTQFGDGATQAPDTATIDLAGLPDWLNTPLMSDPGLMCHVIKGLLGSVASLSSHVDQLQSHALDGRLEALEKRVAEQSDEIVKLRSRASHQTDVRKAKALAKWWHANTFPAFDAWANLAGEQKRIKRRAAMRALNPGFVRCFELWTRRTRSTLTAAGLPDLVLSLMPTTRKRNLERAFGRWRSTAASARRLEQSRLRGDAHDKLKCLRIWLAYLHELAAARARRRKLAPLEPPYPACRAVATGWHTDLAAYGTAISHRDESIIRAEELKKIAYEHAEQLETRLAFAEARASVLERRNQLRDRVFNGGPMYQYDAALAVAEAVAGLEPHPPLDAEAPAPTPPSPRRPSSAAPKGRAGRPVSMSSTGSATGVAGSVRPSTAGSARPAPAGTQPVYHQVAAGVVVQHRQPPPIVRADLRQMDELFAARVALRANGSACGGSTPRSGTSRHAEPRAKHGGRETTVHRIPTAGR